MMLSMVLATQGSPVQKVIELLDDLKGKVQADFANEEKLMEEYSSWCDEEANEKEDAITSSKRTIADLSATIQDAEATTQTLTTDIETLTGSISAGEGDLRESATESKPPRIWFEVRVKGWGKSPPGAW